MRPRVKYICICTRGGGCCSILTPPRNTWTIQLFQIYSFVLSNGSIQPRLRTTENSSSVKGSLFFLNLQTLTQTAFLWLNTFFFKDFFFCHTPPSRLYHVKSNIFARQWWHTYFMYVYEYTHTFHLLFPTVITYLLH